MKNKSINLKAQLFYALLKKIPIAMRITLLLLFVLTFQLQAEQIYSQDAKISLDMKNATIEKVLQTIEEKSDYYFLYNSRLIDVDRKVSVRVRNAPISAVLEKLFNSENVNYEVKGSQIILSPKEMYSQITAVVNALQQQKKTITGTITDADGEPLPGVTVVVKGTTQGTVTDADGNYSLSGVPVDGILQFSFVGMETQEVEVAGKSIINVTMAEEAIRLEEVVAIGYGTQRRENVTGSVATAGPEKIEGEPITTVAQALQGDISGVTIRQPGGRPNPTTEIRIRGYGTFSSAGNDPLVLVDGISSSIDDVNPDDIKNISVLKDAASAAIYGSRAANGVILIETKRGKEGVMEVNYNGYVGFNELADKPEFVDSWIYAQAYNEGLENMGLGKRYSEEDIQKFMSGEFPDTHPNDHHYDMALDNKAYQTKHDLSLSGGNNMTRYHFSLGYLRDDGLLQNNLYDTYKENLLNFYNQYAVRLNVDSDINKKLKLRVNMSGKAGDDHRPAAFTGNQTMGRLITRITRMSSEIPARTSDGWYGRVDLGAPWADIDSESHELDRSYHFLGNTDLEYKFGPLTLIARAGYVINHTNYRRFVAEEHIDPTTYARPNKLTVNWNTGRELTLEGLAKYEQSFGNHDINVLAGYSQIENKYNFLNAFRDNFPTNELFELNVGSSENQQNSGGASEWGLVSYFGRIQYAFSGKYLFEANARYDGSSRFGSGNKFGLFPSFSVGWRISEEKFMKENLSWLYNLKLRGSWGELGNQQIGAYPYQAKLSTGANAIFGNSVFPGIVLNTVPNKDITWETTRIIDLGIDFSVLEGKLDVAIDYYDKTTRDILYNITTAGVLGLGSSPYNAGKVKNEGWDFSLVYRNSIGDFSYSLAPNFSLIKNEVLSLAQVKQDIGQGLFVGQPLNAIYGYIDDGLFVDEQDIQNYPQQPYNPVPGDIKYKDISGPEGVPDGKVTAEYDRTVIGQRSPKYTYGGQLSAKYKAFDLSITFDGAGGMRRYLDDMAGRAFANKSNVQQWMWDNRWTKENPDPNAIYPRFYHHGGGRNEPYSWYSTFWAWDASYLKVRDVQIGFNMPASVTQALKIQRMRLYLSGRNLLTFDNFFPGWDPELNVELREGEHFPMTRTFIFGLNVKF
jgi:TonB-linked SusC/RagA family outer membrane protein